MTKDLVMQVGECSCIHCQRACQHRPGFFTPDQIAPLANALGLTIEQLFKEHLQFDVWTGDPDDIYMLVPRYRGQEGGAQVPFDPRGTCHWFNDGRCGIHTLGKPAECQALGHKDGAQVSADREAIVAAWKDHQDMVRNLAGDDLSPPEGTIFDSIGMMFGGLGGSYE